MSNLNGINCQFNVIHVTQICCTMSFRTLSSRNRDFEWLRAATEMHITIVIQIPVALSDPWALQFLNSWVNRMNWNKPEDPSVISVDRSTKGYSQHLQYLGWAKSSAKRLDCTLKLLFTVSSQLFLVVRQNAIYDLLKHACLKRVRRSRCSASEDSDLEAFSRNPTDDSFAALENRLTAFTNYPNEVFLSYWLRLLLQCQFDQ